MDNYLPVLITAFVRDIKTLELFEKLALLGTTRIYLSVDKGRNSREHDLQKSLINQIEILGAKYKIDLKIRVEPRNQGLAVAVINALDWFFEQEGFGVILEDDLLPSEQFFDFCLKNREVIEFDDSCLLISGNSFGSNTEILEPSFVSYPLIWGWATTKQKWQQIKSEITLRNSFSWKVFSHPGKLGYFLTGLLRSRKGRIDSWAVPLASRMYLGNFKCLIPPSNLVANNGDDENSTHSNSSDWTLNHPVQYLREAKYYVPKVRYSSDQSLIIERTIYGIRWYHAFSPVYAFFFDRFRKFETRLPLLDRLRLSK